MNSNKAATYPQNSPFSANDSPKVAKIRQKWRMPKTSRFCELNNIKKFSGRDCWCASFNITKADGDEASGFRSSTDINTYGVQMKSDFLSKIIKNQNGEGAADFYGGVLAIGLCVIGLTSQCGASTSHQKAKVVEELGPQLPAAPASDEWLIWLIGIIAFVFLILVIWVVYKILITHIERLLDNVAKLESKISDLSDQVEGLDGCQDSNIAQFRNYKERLDKHREAILKLKACSPEYQQALARENEEKALKDAQAALLGGDANA
jgi:hypothetical protein